MLYKTYYQKIKNAEKKICCLTLERRKFDGKKGVLCFSKNVFFDLRRKRFYANLRRICRVEKHKIKIQQKKCYSII